MPQNQNKKFVIRQMEISDCEQVKNIWKVVNFMETKYTNEVYLKVDPRGIFVAQDLVSGKLVGVCSGANISVDLAFVGQYGVLPEYQGFGIGSALWEAIMDHIGPERNISLYSADKMIGKYRDRSNFVVIPQKRGLSLTGRPYYKNLIQAIDGILLQTINEDNTEQVIEYDRQVCGVDRTLFIRETSKIDEYVNAVAVNHMNKIVGYCVVSLSNFNTGIVEPLYADNEKIAELLLAKCCQSLPITQTNGLSYPCWDTNSRSINIAIKLGLKVTNSFPILFTKRIVEGNMDKIFCTSSRCFFPF